MLSLTILSDFGQKSAMITDPNQKGTEVKNSADITAKDKEEVVEIRRSQKDEERTKSHKKRRTPKI